MRRSSVAAGAILGAAVLLTLAFLPMRDLLEGQFTPAGASPGAQRPVRDVRLAGQVIHAEIADTPRTRARGLGGREELVEGEGMLFVFGSPAPYAFWMKDMRFPIDILWLDEAGRVVDIREQVPPESYPAAFTSRAKALYVLELPAGFSERFDVEIGSEAEL